MTAALMLVFMAGRHAPTTRAQEGPSVWDGVYTKAQANRGRGVYRTQCAACHGDRPIGTAMAPSLTGTDFMADFGSSTMGELFEKVSKTMPSSAPGTLPPDAVADVIAFLALSNEWPAGEKELPTDPEALKLIRIVAKK